MLAIRPPLKTKIAARRVRGLPRIVRSRRHRIAKAAASGSRLRQPRTAARLRVAVRATLNLPAGAGAAATGIAQVPANRADQARPATGAAAILVRNSICGSPSRSPVLPEVTAAEATAVTTEAVPAVVRTARRAAAVAIAPVEAADIRAVAAEATTKSEVLTVSPSGGVQARGRAKRPPLLQMRRGAVHGGWRSRPESLLRRHASFAGCSVGRRAARSRSCSCEPALSGAEGVAAAMTFTGRLQRISPCRHGLAYFVFLSPLRERRNRSGRN